MEKRRVFVVLIAVSLLFITLPVFADAGPDAAAIYKSKCAMCHGQDGAGQTPAGKSMKVKDLRSPEVQKMTDKELFTVIAEGKGKMTGFKAKLSQADIDALVGFVRQLKK
jgi:cytochrome c6